MTVATRTRLGRLDWPALRPTYRWDVVLAVAVCGLFALGTAVDLADKHPIAWPIGPLIWVVPFVAIAWRSHSGERLLALILVADLLSAPIGGPNGDMAVLLALYTIGVQRTLRRAAAAWAVTVLVTTLAEIVRHAATGASPTPWDLLFGAGVSLVAGAVVYAVPTAIGLYFGARRAYVRTLLERTESLERERELLERERDLQAREAVTVERARIARELHDVVAHHVSVMVIQAGAAEARLRPEDAAAREAVTAIAKTGREAMTEMRRLLGLLREEAGGEDGDDTRSPQPGVGELSVLAARIAEAGVDVRFVVAGSPVALPRGIDLSAFRVVQEALTNTLRHAGRGARARVEIRYAPGSITVEVTDDGGAGAARAAKPGGAPGHGLVGMRERVALFGGSLEAGPRPGGGFGVKARFPFETPAPEPLEPPGSAPRTVAPSGARTPPAAAEAATEAVSDPPDAGASPAAGAAQSEVRT